MRMFANHKSWLQHEYREWVRALEAATVQNFKSFPMVQRMLGNIEPGLYRDLVTVTPLIEAIDEVGREPGPVSGVGLRMLYYARQVLDRNFSSIVEIGGGVGQFYATLRALGYRGPYYIMDLPEVQSFQRAYLSEVSIRTGLKLPLQSLKKYEACVSFYALGEFDDELKKHYVEEVVKKCRHGFIVWNPHSGASQEIPFECWVTDEFPLNHPDCKQLEW